MSCKWVLNLVFSCHHFEYTISVWKLWIISNIFCNENVIKIRIFSCLHMCANNIFSIVCANIWSMLMLSIKFDIVMFCNGCCRCCTVIFYKHRDQFWGRVRDRARNVHSKYFISKKDRFHASVNQHHQIVHYTCFWPCVRCIIPHHLKPVHKFMI